GGWGREGAGARGGWVAAMKPPYDLDRLGAVFAPTVETTDHRTAGFGSGRGVEWLRRALASAREVADDPLDRIDDVLAAQPNALLMRSTMTGRERLGGGTFESPHLRLHVFGADGLVIRNEVFNADREREARPGLDQLTCESGAHAAFEPRPHWRVRANVAMANIAALNAAVAARDAEAVAAGMADAVEWIDHTTGAVID